ncbi:MAG TPA: anthranilate phosphoribosyltransferase [Verrucomicrobia bacterium]|nr:anthranilate phosphoribosyltransferase [Verrucomicrobiota bacterium]
MLELTALLESGNNLNQGQITIAAEALLKENDETATKTKFLKALSAKGETPAEIAAFVETFLKHAVDPGFRPEDCNGPTIDVCGTGGDKLDLFNISTSSVFVLAGGGLTVLKHGNRGITSKSGGADVLEELGVPINLPVPALRECVLENGAGFLFAPLYHPAFKAVVPVRKALAEEGIRTVFNLIGPLLNPVRPDYQLVGVFDSAFTSPFAEILGRLGRKKAWAVHGKGQEGEGLDELSLSGKTKVSEWNGAGVNESEITPEDLGLESCAISELKGGDPKENASILISILDGTDCGPKRDIVALNAAAGFVICGSVSDMTDGFELALEVIKDGRALAKLNALRNFSV